MYACVYIFTYVYTMYIFYYSLMVSYIYHNTYYSHLITSLLLRHIIYIRTYISMCKRMSIMILFMSVYVRRYIYNFDL